MRQKTQTNRSAFFEFLFGEHFELWIPRVGWFVVDGDPEAAARVEPSIPPDCPAVETVHSELPVMERGHTPAAAK